MKKCTHCGKEYPDDKLVCEVDAWPLTEATSGVPPLLERRKRISGRFVIFLCIVAVQLLVYFAGGYWHEQGRNAIAYAVDPIVGYEGSKEVQGFIGFLASPVSIVVVVLVFIVMELEWGRQKK